MSFDLAEFDGLAAAQDDGIDVEIKGPDGKKLGSEGFSIRVAGPDSKRFREALRELSAERIDAEDLTELSAEQLEENRVRILAKCVISWTPVVMGGQALECSEANARQLFERYPFIREQVERRAGRRASFLPRSAKGSAGQSGKGTSKSGSASPQ